MDLLKEMQHSDERVRQFLASSPKAPDATTKSPVEEILPERDGLLERTEYVNPRLVDRQGRQLLREELFDNIND